MQLRSKDLTDGQPIDPKFAFCKPDPETHAAEADNVSPHLAWDGLPEGAASFALLCVDPDVPAEADDVNQEGKTLPKDMPRMDFYHWVMIDMPVGVTELQTGECSDGVTAGGKDNPPGPAGNRQGQNDFTQFLAEDEEMSGTYYGYDGPCPPWNDEQLHHYRFIVYALDVEKLDVPDDFDGRDVKKAIDGHVLDRAMVTGTYTMNPALA